MQETARTAAAVHTSDGPAAEWQPSFSYALAERLLTSADDPERRSTARSELLALAALRGEPAGDFCLAVFERALSLPRLHRRPPRDAARAVLRLVVALAGVAGATVDVRGADGAETRIATAGAPADGEDTSRLTVHLRRFEQPAGTIELTGVHNRGEATAYAASAAETLEALLERDLLREQSEEREHTATATLERHLERLAFDVHDGALQELAALGIEVGLFRRQIGPLVTPERREQVEGRFDDLAARLSEIDRTLRSVLNAAKGAASGREPLGARLRREVEALADDGVDVHLELNGELESLSESRKIALFRVVQEACSNIRRHSGAGVVDVSIVEYEGAVELSIADDGCGFDVEETMASGGRFGLAGMIGRIRLLGGEAEVDSAPGCGTRISFQLAPWQPVSRTADGSPLAALGGTECPTTRS